MGSWLSFTMTRSAGRCLATLSSTLLQSQRCKLVGCRCTMNTGLKDDSEVVRLLSTS